MSFVGTYNHSLDSKKRVFVPSKFREELGNEFYITRKFDAYLSIYTAEDWEAYVDKISKLPEADALSMAYKAIQSGAKGVDMGRNIFQSSDPIAMCRAVGKVVHAGYTAEEAYEFFLDMSK